MTADRHDQGGPTKRNIHAAWFGRTPSESDLPMAAKKMAKDKARAFSWVRNAWSRAKGARIVVADPTVFRGRTGDESDGPAELVEVVSARRTAKAILPTRRGAGRGRRLEGSRGRCDARVE